MSYYLLVILKLDQYYKQNNLLQFTLRLINQFNPVYQLVKKNYFYLATFLVTFVL